MVRRIQLRNLSTVLDEITYPIGRTAALDALADVTVVFADREAHLDTLITKTGRDTFETTSDIETALHNVVRRGDVGKSDQS